MKHTSGTWWGGLSLLVGVLIFLEGFRNRNKYFSDGTYLDDLTHKFLHQFWKEVFRVTGGATDFKFSGFRRFWKFLHNLRHRKNTMTVMDLVDIADMVDATVEIRLIPPPAKPKKRPTKTPIQVPVRDQYVVSRGEAECLTRKTHLLLTEEFSRSLKNKKRATICSITHNSSNGLFYGWPTGGSGKPIRNLKYTYNPDAVTCKKCLHELNKPGRQAFRSMMKDAHDEYLRKRRGIVMSPIPAVEYSERECPVSWEAPENPSFLEDVRNGLRKFLGDPDRPVVTYSHVYAIRVSLICSGIRFIEVRPNVLQWTYFLTPEQVFQRTGMKTKALHDFGLILLDVHEAYLEYWRNPKTEIRWLKWQRYRAFRPVVEWIQRTWRRWKR